MSKKFARFVKTMVKFLILKCWIHFTNTRNYAVTYYKTLEKVSWHLGLKELKKWRFFKKLEKIVKISIKLSVFSDRLFERSHGVCVCVCVYVCVWEGVTEGADGEGGGSGGNNAVGGGGEAIVAGVQQWGCLQPPFRPSHHTYKSPKQFELTESLKTLRALNACWALPVYPVFEDKVKRVRRKIDQAKNRIKKRLTGLI